MKTYQKLLQTILDEGVDRPDRTGVGTRSLFGYQMRFDLQAGFPLLTTKKVFMKGIVHELLWFLRGETNIRSLQAEGVRIWDEWADEQGELGSVYGAQWRSWLGHDGRVHDQIKSLVEGLQQDPYARRHVVCSWNVGELDNMALPPCHCLFQFYRARDTLSCQLYQRSADVFLGVPFNIASYALLTLMIAQVLGVQPGDFVHTLGDAHVYHNHLDQARLLLSREPRPLPTVRLDPTVRNVLDFRYEHIQLLGYDPHPAIPAPIAV